MRNRKAATERHQVFFKQGVAVLILWSLVMASGLSVIYSTHNSRRLQHELETMLRQTNDLHVEWNQYLLEYSAWADYSHVETKAGESLHMEIPRAEKIVVVEH